MLKVFSLALFFVMCVFGSFDSLRIKFMHRAEERGPGLGCSLGLPSICKALGLIPPYHQKKIK